jgi:hypothetical protein
VLVTREGRRPPEPPNSAPGPPRYARQASFEWGYSAPPKPPVGCAEYDGASVPVLLRLGALEQQRVGRLVCNGPVLDPTRHDEEIPGLERDRIATLQFNTEHSLPAQEQLVFVVVVPRELAVETSDTDHGIVDRHKVLRLERFEQISGGGGQRDRCHARSVAATTVSVSRRSQRSCGQPKRRDSRSAWRPTTSYGGGLRPCGLVHFYTARRVSRLRAPLAGLTGISEQTAARDIRWGLVGWRRP